jgi:hypothetical protein
MHNKKSRSLTMASNCKKKQIKNIMVLQQEMVNNNIDQKLIDEFINDQYEIINNEYNLKVEKYNNKILSNLEINKSNKEKIKNRNKEISNLIKNKIILDKNGIDKEYINNYIINQYQNINNKYNDIILDSDDQYNIEFID